LGFVYDACGAFPKQDEDDVISLFDLADEVQALGSPAAIAGGKVVAVNLQTFWSADTE
jgi:hypothetical protein